MFTFKDLGKIKNKDNKTIKPNMIIKSGYLYKLKKSKVKQLQEHHLAKVIDLRTEAERAQKPDRQIEGVKYVNIPLFNEKIATVTHEEENSLKENKEMYKIIDNKIDGNLSLDNNIIIEDNIQNISMID